MSECKVCQRPECIARIGSDSAYREACDVAESESCYRLGHERMRGALEDALENGQHGEDCAVWWVDVDGHRRPFETKDRRCDCWIDRTARALLAPTPAPKEEP